MFSINPCETAIKGTKKLLAIVSTFASREFVLVEVMQLVGKLFYLQFFMLKQ